MGYVLEEAMGKSELDFGIEASLEDTGREGQASEILEGEKVVVPIPSGWTAFLLGARIVHQNPPHGILAGVGFHKRESLNSSHFPHHFCQLVGARVCVNKKPFYVLLVEVAIFGYQRRSAFVEGIPIEGIETDWITKTEGAVNERVDPEQRIQAELPKR